MRKIKKLIQKILGISFIRKTLKAVNTNFYAFISSNRFIASIYIFLTPWSGNRERYAILKGKAQYYRNLKKVDVNSAGLRRNTHRLEKALIMEPRRKSFALSYIEETVEIYEMVVNSKLIGLPVDPNELHWATDVLAAYFDAVENDDFITRLKQRYQESASKVNIKKDKQAHAPFKRSESPENPVEFKDLLQLANRRRSVRWFKKKKVPRKLIDQALLVARQSPSACNRQPFEFRIFDDPKKVKAVASLPFGAEGYAHNIQTVVVVVGKQDYYFSSRDRHVIYIDASLAVMAFMLALETLGLASSSINWPDFEPLELKMQKLLGLKPSDRVVMMMAIGYARDDGGIPYSEKKTLDALRSYNKLADE